MKKAYEIQFKASEHSNEVRTWVQFADNQGQAEKQAEKSIENEFWGQGVLINVKEKKTQKIAPPRYKVNYCYTLHHTPTTTNASQYTIYRTDYNGEKGEFGFPTQVIAKPPSKLNGKKEMQALYRQFEDMQVCAISPDKTMVILQY